MTETPAQRPELWEDNGALAVVVSAVGRIKSTLNHMVDATRILKQNFAEHGEIDWEKVKDRDWEEIHKLLVLLGDLFTLEHELSCDCRTAILMAAIAIESEVNRFLFFSIGEELANSIERLSVEAKLMLAHRMLNLSNFKGTKPHQAAVEIFRWRDRFAHGKLPDIPSGDLRSIHIEGAHRYKAAREELADAVKLLEHYLVLRGYIVSIETGHTGRLGDPDVETLSDRLRDIKHFSFVGEHEVFEGPPPRAHRNRLVPPPPMPMGMVSDGRSSRQKR